MAIERHAITTTYPCCDDNEEFGLGRNPKMRLTLIDCLPRMAFKRRCPSCGSHFDIEVRQQCPMEGMTIHYIEWEEVRA